MSFSLHWVWLDVSEISDRRDSLFCHSKRVLMIFFISGSGSVINLSFSISCSKSFLSNQSNFSRTVQKPVNFSIFVLYNRSGFNFSFVQLFENAFFNIKFQNFFQFWVFCFLSVRGLSHSLSPKLIHSDFVSKLTI